MIKKTITFTDYKGLERTEDFYFNLSRAEVAEMEMSIVGGFSEKIQRIVQEQDPEKIIKLFKEIILTSYGEKSEDGRRFIKTDQIQLDFSHTEAFSQLFMEIAQDAKAAAEFINAIIPDVPNDEKQ